MQQFLLPSQQPIQLFPVFRDYGSLRKTVFYLVSLLAILVIHVGLIYTAIYYLSDTSQPKELKPIEVAIIPLATTIEQTTKKVTQPEQQKTIKKQLPPREVSIQKKPLLQPKIMPKPVVQQKPIIATPKIIETPRLTAPTATGEIKAPVESNPVREQAIEQPVSQVETPAPVKENPVQKDTSPVKIDIASISYIKQPQPEYPETSQELGEKGTALVAIEIDTTGRVVSASIKKSSGYERLDKEAVRAVKKAKFSPYKENGEARSAKTVAPITFE